MNTRPLGSRLEEPAYDRPPSANVEQDFQSVDAPDGYEAQRPRPPTSQPAAGTALVPPQAILRRSDSDASIGRNIRAMLGETLGVKGNSTKIVNFVTQLAECCVDPITEEPMADPVLFSDGVCYDRSTVQRQPNDLSPFTRAPKCTIQGPVDGIRKLIHEFVSLSREKFEMERKNARDSLARPCNDSVAILQEKISNRPFDGHAHAAIGNRYEASGDYENALRSYEQAIKCLADPSDLPVSRSRCLLQAKLPVGRLATPEEYEKAKHAAIDAISHSRVADDYSPTVRAHFASWKALLTQDRTAAARALELAPSDPQSLAAAVAVADSLSHVEGLIARLNDLAPTSLLTFESLRKQCLLKARVYSSEEKLHYYNAFEFADLIFDQATLSGDRAMRFAAAQSAIICLRKYCVATASVESDWKKAASLAFGKYSELLEYRNFAKEKALFQAAIGKKNEALEAYEISIRTLVIDELMLSKEQWMREMDKIAHAMEKMLDVSLP